MTRGVERCLVIYDADGWRTVSDQVRTLNAWLEDARRMQRHFFGGAVQAQPDKLGRVVIPQFVRTYAQLDSDVVVVGVADRVEVWANSQWERQRADAERDSAQLADHLATQRPG